MRIDGKNVSPGYLLNSDEESLSLKRQSKIYGNDDDLYHLALAPTDNVLDAGCGSGTTTIAIAKTAWMGQVTGFEREPNYIDFACRKSDSAGIKSIRKSKTDASTIC